MGKLLRSSNGVSNYITKRHEVFKLKWTSHAWASTQLTSIFNFNNPSELEDSNFNPYNNTLSVPIFSFFFFFFC